jgi:hypothetical protein
LQSRSARVDYFDLQHLPFPSSSYHFVFLSCSKHTENEKLRT